MTNGILPPCLNDDDRHSIGCGCVMAPNQLPPGNAQIVAYQMQRVIETGNPQATCLNVKTQEPGVVGAQEALGSSEQVSNPCPRKVRILCVSSQLREDL